ncbi:RNAse P Rpr2/Rpp21/SNM1 subunit domain-containing protein [Lenzites betulinus]|nr:RNAse P Rpr2/Rpp21/SNM1 subunit domain-containing protein [Lenzites betulinus]
MGKKGKDQEPVASLNSVANRDIIQRINFLYQASTYLNSISQAGPRESNSEGSSALNVGESSKGKSRKKRKVRHPKDASELSRSYIGSMRQVGQKTMVRMDPSIKRTLCKSCDTVLLPGSTVTVRIMPNSRSYGQSVVYKCLTCNTSRRIPAPPVLDVDALPFPDTAASKDAAPPPPSDTGGEQPMDIDPNPKQTKGKQKPKRAVARVPPLFERKGHVVFRGNERLPEDDAAV